MPQNTIDDKSALVQVIAWCRQAPSHYLSQCWHRFMSPCGVSRPQQFNHWDAERSYEILSAILYDDVISPANYSIRNNRYPRKHRRTYVLHFAPPCLLMAEYRYVLGHLHAQWWPRYMYRTDAWLVHKDQPSNQCIVELKPHVQVCIHILQHLPCEIKVMRHHNCCCEQYQYQKWFLFYKSDFHGITVTRHEKTYMNH